jgi:hypothetical protein
MTIGHETPMTPERIVKLLRIRKQYEKDLAALDTPKIRREVMRPNSSNCGGSWKQHITATVTSIEKVDLLLASSGIRLPMPHKWWIVE